MRSQHFCYLLSVHMKIDGKERQWENIEDNEVHQVFDILTGSSYFARRPFSNDETEPDLVIKWRLSEEKLINRSQFEDVGRYISVPPYCLQKGFELAEKRILFEMNEKKENQDNKEVQFRFIQNLMEVNEGKERLTKVQYDTGGDEEIKLMCYDEKLPILDGFTLNYNSVMYMLQRVCGFKVRAFMVHTEEENKEGIMAIAGKVGLGLLTKRPVRDIYLFLNLSIQNMLKVAGRFEVKKELDYSVIDFFLNDPSTYDNRPIKYHSKIKIDDARKKEIKALNRFFRTKESFDINTDILDEKELSLLEEQRFQSYWQEINLIFQFFKVRVGDEVSNEQKIYLYNYNRGKLNVGCQKILALIKKRREFYQLTKDICEKYQYKNEDEPVFLGEFILPHKNAKGGFFQKLKSILLYKSMEVSPYGDLGLFLSMEKTKLCYLMIKSTFKVNYLKRMGIDILTLNNDFQKTGEGGQNQMVRGGLAGTFLVDRWYPFALFSDIKNLRNYFGDVLAHEIMLRIAIISYLLIISVPYAVLYIFEILYTDRVYLYSTMIEAGLFAITFSMFVLLVQEMEEGYSRAYSDKRHSTVFINQFRGPYIRNILTDQLNEFQQQTGIWIFIKNFFCLIIFCILIVMFGLVFYGCRSLLIAIQPGLYSFETEYISLSHLLSYSIYFVVGDLFKMKFYDKVVRIMLWIKNPSSDESQRNLRSYFTFYYLLCLELIPIGFFFVLQPFAGTACYGYSCDFQFYNYIYARFFFNIAMAGIGFVNAVIFNWAKKKLLNIMEEEKKSNTFPERLGRMLKNAVDESLREHYDDGLTKDILALFAYGFYCSELAISGLIALATIMTVYFVARLSLIHEYRRPINKSQPIIHFSRYCKAIYFVGLLINIAINTFLLLYIERYYIFVINLAPEPLTSSTIFMIKIAFSAFFFIVVSILGIIGRYIGIAFSPKSLINRQRQKYKQYYNMVSGPKTISNKPSKNIPVKSVFRTFNPDKMPHELLIQALEEQRLGLDMVANELNELLDPGLRQTNSKMLGKTNLKATNTKLE